MRVNIQLTRPCTDPVRFVLSRGSWFRTFSSRPMLGRLFFAGSVWVSIAQLASAASAAAPVAKLSYNEHIQPILAENCFACHGPDSSTRKGKLRLDRFEFATVQRGDHEPAIVPGDAKASPLVERITATDEDDR